MRINKFLLIVLLLLSNGLFSQNNSILYQISGNGISKPSYLFGTIHAYCDGDKLFTPELISKIQATDIVALELNLNDFSTFVAIMKASMKEGKYPISSYLTEKEYAKVDSVCIAILGDSLKNLDKQTPMALMGKIFLSEGIIGCKPVPVDFIVADLAKREGKKTFGFETASFQDSILNSAGDSIQVRWLVDLCYNLEKSKADFTMLMNAYNSQDAQALYDFSLKTSPEMLFMKEILLDQRNINWVNFLKSNMNLQSYFIAVGAGHLAGEKGLLDLLRQAGYTLTPIKI